MLCYYVYTIQNWLLRLFFWYKSFYYGFQFGIFFSSSSCCCFIVIFIADLLKAWLRLLTTQNLKHIENLFQCFLDILWWCCSFIILLELTHTHKEELFKIWGVWCWKVNISVMCACVCTYGVNNDLILRM